MKWLTVSIMHIVQGQNNGVRVVFHIGAIMGQTLWADGES